VEATGAPIMQVSASSFAQKITLSEKKVPIQKVFDKIRIQTNYDFLFSDDILKDAKPITIEVKDADLKTVLNKIFDGQPLEYSIEDKSIVVSKKEKSFIDKMIARFQEIDARGKIVDETALHVTSVFTKKGEHAVLDHIADADEEVLVALGYKQEFKRSVAHYFLAL